MNKTLVSPLDEALTHKFSLNSRYKGVGSKYKAARAQQGFFMDSVSKSVKIYKSLTLG